MKTTTTQQLGAYLLLAASLLLTTVAFVLFFEQLPTEGTTLGIDNIFYEVDNWDIHYTITDGLRNPPWSVLPLVPVGSLLSWRQAWGVLVCFTVAVTIASVPPTPQRWRYWLAIFLAVASFPSLRNIADANLEGLVIGGVLLVIIGYTTQRPWLLAMGILVATIKPQSVSLLMVVVGAYVLHTWSPQHWLRLGAWVAVVVVPTLLWRGEAWVAALRGTYQAGSIIDISLGAALNRTELFPPIVVTLCRLGVLGSTLGMAWMSHRTLSREKAGMLLCGSMLVAPYVAGNSIMTILAIALIPLFLADLRLGGVLIAMVNVPFLWSPQWLTDYQAYWWTLTLISTWVLLNLRLYQYEITRPLAAIPPLFAGESPPAHQRLDKPPSDSAGGAGR